MHQASSWCASRSNPAPVCFHYAHAALYLCMLMLRVGLVLQCQVLELLNWSDHMIAETQPVNEPQDACFDQLQHTGQLDTGGQPIEPVALISAAPIPAIHADHLHQRQQQQEQEQLQAVKLSITTSKTAVNTNAEHNMPHHGSPAEANVTVLIQAAMQTDGCDVAANEAVPGMLDNTLDMQPQELCVPAHDGAIAAGANDPEHPPVDTAANASINAHVAASTPAETLPTHRVQAAANAHAAAMLDVPDVPLQGSQLLVVSSSLADHEHLQADSQPHNPDAAADAEAHASDVANLVHNNQARGGANEGTDADDNNVVSAIQQVSTAEHRHLAKPGVNGSITACSHDPSSSPSPDGVGTSSGGAGATRDTSTSEQVGTLSEGATLSEFQGTTDRQLHQDVEDMHKGRLQRVHCSVCCAMFTVCSCCAMCTVCKLQGAY